MSSRRAGSDVGCPTDCNCSPLDRTVLVLEDPGGVPLAQLLGQPLDIAFSLHLAISLFHCKLSSPMTYRSYRAIESNCNK
jgi:hypothetical protein